MHLIVDLIKTFVRRHPGLNLHIEGLSSIHSFGVHMYDKLHMLPVVYKKDIAACLFVYHVKYRLGCNVHAYSGIYTEELLYDMCMCIDYTSNNVIYNTCKVYMLDIGLPSYKRFLLLIKCNTRGIHMDVQGVFEVSDIVESSDNEWKRCNLYRMNDYILSLQNVQQVYGHCMNTFYDVYGNDVQRREVYAYGKVIHMYARRHCSDDECVSMLSVSHVMCID